MAKGKTVYLAGPIFGRSNQEVHGWRDIAKSLLPGVEVLDPSDRDFRGHELENMFQIVEGDKAEIDRADALLVCFDGIPSVGTSMEVLYAWERGKYIVILTPLSGAPIPPWLQYHSFARFAHLDEACRCLLGQLRIREE